MKRQRENLCHGGFGLWQRERCRFDVRVARLLMDRRRIMEGHGNAARGEVAHECIAHGAADDVKMIGVLASLAHDWHDGVRTAAQFFIVARGQRAARGHAGGQGRELHAQDGGLHLVQTAVHAFAVAVVSLLPAVLADHADALGECVIVRGDCTTVADGS